MVPPTRLAACVYAAAELVAEAPRATEKFGGIMKGAANVNEACANNYLTQAPQPLMQPPDLKQAAHNATQRHFQQY